MCEDLPLCRRLGCNRPLLALKINESGAYEAKFSARGVIHSLATQTDDPTEDPRFGSIGKQKIEDTGELHRERMKTFDETEVAPAPWSS